MDLVMLSRLQFAVAVFFHFIFVPLTLGLTVLLAIMETIYVRTGDETYKRMAKFWGKLFLINWFYQIMKSIYIKGFLHIFPITCNENKNTFYPSLSFLLMSEFPRKL